MSTKHVEMIAAVMAAGVSAGGRNEDVDCEPAEALRAEMGHLYAENQRLRALLAKLDGELSDLRLIQVAVPRLRSEIAAALTEPDA